jgi:hypothetical protein
MFESNIPTLSPKTETLAQQLNGRLISLPPDLQNAGMGINNIIRLRLPEKGQKFYYKAIYRQDPDLVQNYVCGLLRTGKSLAGKDAHGSATAKETSMVVNDLEIKDLVRQLAIRPKKETYEKIIQELDKKNYSILADDAKIALRLINNQVDDLRKKAFGKNLIFPKKIEQLEYDDPFFALACLSSHKETFHGEIGHSPWISISNTIPLDYLYRGKEEALLAIMTIPDTVPVIDLSMTMQKLNSEHLGVSTSSDDLLLPVELNRNFLLGLIPIDLSKHDNNANKELENSLTKVVNAYFKSL